MVPVYHLNQYIAFYCDYYYQRSGSHYARRGGTSGSSRMAGIFFNNIYITIADTGASNGACLSFKQIIVEDQPSLLLLLLKRSVQNEHGLSYLTIMLDKYK